MIREHLHAMLSVRAMLRVAEKGVSAVSEEDFAGCFGDILDRPDADLLAQIKSNVATAAAASGLVFMHSAYENAVFDLIKRLVQYDPSPWIHLIDKKTIRFETIRSCSVAEMEETLLTKWLEEAERKSFPWKVERILAVLQPTSTKDVIPGFEFKLEDFKAIDELRHDMTHRPNFAAPLCDVYSKVKYLHNTFLLLEKLAEQKYPGGAIGG